MHNSCRIVPPARISLALHLSTAEAMPRQLTFFVSVRVPGATSGVGRSDTLMSARTLPRSMRAFDTSSARKMSRRGLHVCGGYPGARFAGALIGRHDLHERDA